MGDSGTNSASPSFFLFPLLFLMGGALAPPVGNNMRAHVPRWRRGLQNRVWWGQFPTVRAIGVTSCLAAARSVSLRKWSFLCAVRKRQDEGIYLLAGTGFVKMNGCDRRTGAGLKSSVVGLGTTVLERNPRRGCGVVAVVLGQSRLGEAKAGYRRANDKGQWWEAGAADKEGSEQNGKSRMSEKIQKRQANAGSH